MDMAMVSNLREQLEQSEMRIREMQEAHSAREKELQAQLAELHESLKQANLAADEAAAAAAAAKAALESASHAEQAAEAQESAEQAAPAAEETAASAKDAAEEAAAQIELREKKISELEAELAAWEEKHNTALQNMRDAEEVTAQIELREKKISELEAELAGWEEKHNTALQGMRDAEEVAAQIELREKKISELEAELASWEERHNTALQGMRDAEEQMQTTIRDLEAQVASVTERLADAERKKPEEEEALKEAEMKRNQLIDFLRSEIDEYKGIINSNQNKVAEVEHQHAATKKLLEMATHDRDQASSELEAHKALVAKLEAQIADHEQTIKGHQESLQELQSKHAKDVEELLSSSKQDLESQLAALRSEHADRVRRLEGYLTEAREDLMKVATQVAFALGLDVSVEKISERIEDLVADQKALVHEQERRAELESHVVELSNINDTIMRDLEAVRASLAEVLEAEGEQAKSPYPVKEQVALVKKKVVDLETKNKKNSRLVEELEDQLRSNYDQVQMASNRLSTLQMERNAQLEEANAAKMKLQSELDAIREEYTALQVSSLFSDRP
jgi:kinesin family protein 4/21/27